MLTINEFKKFLVLEILAKSNVCASVAYAEVCDFSKTQKFLDAYNKWKVLKTSKNHCPQGPRHIRDIFTETFGHPGRI